MQDIVYTDLFFIIKRYFYMKKILDLLAMQTIMREILFISKLIDEEVIMRSIKNFIAPADLVNVHIPET